MKPLVITAACIALFLACWGLVASATATEPLHEPCETPYIWLSMLSDPSDQLWMGALRVQCVTDEFYLSIGSATEVLPSDNWQSGDMILIVSHSGSDLIPDITPPQGTHLFTVEQDDQWLENANDVLTITIEDERGEYTNDIPIDQADVQVIAFDAASPYRRNNTKEEWMDTYTSSNLPILYSLFPNPEGEDRDQEYIEILNAHDEELQLDGFSVSDTARSYVFEDAFIEPESTTTIHRTTSGIVLNNQAETVWLSNTLGLPLDQATYPQAREDQLYTRTERGWSWCSEDLVCQPDADEEFIGSDNETDPPAQSPVNPAVAEHVILSEFYASPQNGGAEWIELQNTSSDPMPLLGYQLDDQEGGSSPFTFTAEHLIHPNSFLVIESTESRITLNNTGDAVRFLSPEGDVLSEFRYQHSDPDTSWSWVQNAWQETPPSPHAPNHVPQSTPTQNEETVSGAPQETTPAQGVRSSYSNTTIEPIYTLPEETPVLLRGVVSAPTNTLTANGLVMEDETAGIQIIGKSIELPSISHGTSITVKGVVDLYRSVPVVRVTSLSDIEQETSTTPLTPKTTSLSEAVSLAGEHKFPIGTYILTTGSVEKKQGQSITLGDDGSELITTIRSRTTLKAPSIKTGDTWSVSGILLPSQNGLRLYPFQAADLTNSTDTETALASASGEERAEVLDLSSGTHSSEHVAASAIDALMNSTHTLPPWAKWSVGSLMLVGISLYGMWNYIPSSQDALKHVLLRIRSSLQALRDRIRVSHQKTGEEGRQRDG